MFGVRALSPAIALPGRPSTYRSFWLVFALEA